MTVFNMNGATPVRFSFEDGGWVELRLLNAETLKRIDQASVTRRVEYKRVEGRAERFEVADTDSEIRDALFWDHLIADWGDLYDTQGEPIPCTKETKLLLLSRSPKFRAFITENLERLQGDEVQRQAALQKN